MPFFWSTHSPGKDRLEAGLAMLTITYTLETEFENDLAYDYLVTEIDYAQVEQDTYLVTGTVTSVDLGRKAVALDLCGLGDFELGVTDAAGDLPEVGAYVCVRYASAGGSRTLLGYDELPDPGQLTEVTHQVAEVHGSNLVLVADGADASAEENGYPSRLVIEYGYTDMSLVPQVGASVTVRYHDEPYGDVNDVDEQGLTAMSLGSGFTMQSEQAEPDDLNDSADTPGYIELGDEYALFNYGNEAIHVANVIVAASGSDDDTPPSGGGDGDGAHDAPAHGRTVDWSPEAPHEGSLRRSLGSGYPLAGRPGTGSAPTTPAPTTGVTTPSAIPSPTADVAATGSTSIPSPATGIGTTVAIPNTSDALTGMSALSTLAGIAGAGMVAYSVRRTALEHRGDDPSGTYGQR